jgi:hypothetical protein
MKNPGRPVVQSEQSESGVLHCPFEPTPDVKALMLLGEKPKESLDVVVKMGDEEGRFDRRPARPDVHANLLHHPA